MKEETFGQRLARLRKAKGLTQGEIADRIGVTAQAVSKWENDQASPDLDALLRLSEILGVSSDELLGRKATPVTMGEKRTKKDIGRMFLRIKIEDNKDSVNINLPLAILPMIIDRETGKINLMEGNEKLEGIDFAKIIELIEEGLVGEIMTLESKDGGKIRIVVEE